MKLTCFCGKTFRLSDIPRKETFRLYDDIALDRLVQKIMSEILPMEGNHDESLESVENLFFRFKPPEVEAVECPSCKRLLVMLGNRIKLSYIREDTSSRIEGGEPSTLLEVFEKGRQDGG